MFPAFFEIYKSCARMRFQPVHRSKFKNKNEKNLQNIVKVKLFEQRQQMLAQSTCFFVGVTFIRTLIIFFRIFGIFSKICSGILQSKRSEFLVRFPPPPVKGAIGPMRFAQVRNCEGPRALLPSTSCRSPRGLLPRSFIGPFHR